VSGKASHAPGNVYYIPSMPINGMRGGSQHRTDAFGAVARAVVPPKEQLLACGSQRTVFLCPNQFKSHSLRQRRHRKGHLKSAQCGPKHLRDFRERGVRDLRLYSMAAQSHLQQDFTIYFILTAYLRTVQRIRLSCTQKTSTGLWAAHRRRNGVVQGDSRMGNRFFRKSCKENLKECD